jgi:hypothetical protein
MRSPRVNSNPRTFAPTQRPSGSVSIPSPRSGGFERGEGKSRFIGTRERGLPFARFPASWIAAALVVVLLAGCAGTGGALTAKSFSYPGKSLTGTFDRGFYQYEGDNHVTMVLLQGPEEKPVMAAVVRMMWMPTPGHTPSSSNATNATVNLIVLPGGPSDQVGVYSGAGFLFPDGTPGDTNLSASLWDADLRLSDRSAGFSDLLGLAQMTGKVSATLDAGVTASLLHKLDVLVRERLAYPHLVRDENGPVPAIGTTRTYTAAKSDKPG